MRPLPAMSEPLLLALDQGTSGTTALLLRPGGQVVARAYKEVSISHPKPGWVEQDAAELWSSVCEAAGSVLRGAEQPPVAIGITNQRETVVLLDRRTMAPVTPAIVWQDRRTAGLCAAHRERGEEPGIREHTGLLLDPYFSATKIEMLLGDSHLRSRAERGEIVATTMDAFLMARMTGGRTIATDASNASRTLLYDLHIGAFSTELCELFNVPPSVLPEICASSGQVAITDPDAFLGLRIPVCGVAGDQQAALFGQACVRQGMSKNTYGTGSFVLVNIGTEIPKPARGLLTTVAWRIDGKDQFALEGSIFVTGQGLKWLRDSLHLIERVDEAGPLFDSVPDTHGCYFIPALAGLGAPYWDPEARGALLGLSGGVTKAHVVRAVVEAMAYRTRDVVEAMESAAGVQFAELRVDGGASVMDGLCQFQADLLGIPVARAATAETTALGAAWLAALGSGVFNDADEIAAQWQAGRRFEAAEPGCRPHEMYEDWKHAVARVRN